MTSWHICTMLTPRKRKTSLPSKFIQLLFYEKATTLGHHKRAVTPIGTLPGSLAGKMYFQILATDNYVSNKNKPFLPGMLKQNHLSVSIFSRHRGLKLRVLRCACAVWDYVSNGSKTVPFFLTRFPPLGSHRKPADAYAPLAWVFTFAS